VTDLLALRGLVKIWSGQSAVDNVSLTIPPGEFHALLGPSGCGKTTTLRMVAGFELPTSGQILLNGRNLEKLPPWERPVSTVFQSYALFPHMTVAENIAFGPRRREMPGYQKRIEELVAMLRLEDKQQRLPAQLSGGEKQRVALARALVMQPELLLLDEPLSALDPRLRRSVRTELKAIQRSTGITFLMVTHDQEEALGLADRITVMNKGRVEQTGSPREIYLRPASPFVAEFLGRINWINGIGLRPESMKIVNGQPGPVQPPHNFPSLPAAVSSCTFLGNCLHVELALHNGEQAVAEVPEVDHEFRAGQNVLLWWDPADELRF
jgi:spermidine/putrescine transport system ATP-binding protein